MDLIHDKLKEIVLNVKEPHIITNLNIPWPCLSLSFEEWCTQFDSSLSPEHAAEGGIVFETGTRKYTNQPQWEKVRGKVRMTVKEFYENSNKASEFFESNWAAFGYKNIKELPSDCASGFDFSYFGFPEVKDDITFWLSSSDAHTPCHFDTYGCNIVVQVYGIKSWMLFSPDTKLTPTRIPYEESSVYCTESLFSPKDVSSYSDIEDCCYTYNLQPGDVLIVPPKWWHYVENTCPALSVNAWIPIESDEQSQIEECVVRILIQNFINGIEINDVSEILNPNELDLLQNPNNLFDILQYLVDHKNKSINTKHRHNYLSEEKLATLLKSFKGQIVPVPKLSKNEFREIIINRTKRFDLTLQEITALDRVNYLKQTLINSVCNPSVISTIAKYFVKNANKDIQ